MNNIIEIIRTEDGNDIHILDVESNEEITDVNKKHAVLKLKQESASISKSNYTNEIIKYYNLNGSVKGLGLLLRDIKDKETNTVPGRLIIHEYPECDVPDELATRFYNHRESDPALFFVKRAGKDSKNRKGPVMFHKGERIIRFTLWENNYRDDVVLTYDMTQEMKDWIDFQQNGETDIEGSTPDTPVK